MVFWELDNVDRINDDGSTNDTQALSAFLQWCADTGTKPTIQIPTAVFGEIGSWAYDTVTGETEWAETAWAKIIGTDGLLDRSDPNYADFKAAVYNYVYSVMQAATEVNGGDIHIEAFEIGNEYASFFNSKTYGRLAAEIAIITEEAIKDFNAANAGYDASNSPKILVQIRSSLSNGAGSTPLSPEDMENRTDTVIAEFTNTMDPNDATASALEYVDGVVSHYYFRHGEIIDDENGSGGIEQSYDTISGRFDDITKLVKAWEDVRQATGMADYKVDWYVTEWNVGAKTLLDQSDPDWEDQANYGMKQIAVLLEIFSSMVAGGVDNAFIWSSQNHGTSVGEQDGTDGNNLQVAGHFMNKLQEMTRSKQYYDLDLKTEKYDAHYFADGDDGVLFIPSLQEGTQTIKVDLWSLGANVDYVTVIVGKFDTSNPGDREFDGEFTGSGMTFDNLPSYLEADGNITWETKTVPVINGVVQVKDLGAYEVAIIEIPLPVVLAGVDDDAVDKRDVIEGGDDAEYMIGLEGNDWLKGKGGNDLVDGGIGNDSVYGGLGNDVVIGGAGNDFVSGGAGDDILQGSDGDDKLAGGAGADHHDGGAGVDYIDYRYIDGGGIGINMLVGNAWGKAAGDSFNSVENIWGSLYNDKIVGTNDRNVLIGGGHDNVDARGGNDVLYGGWGHDVLDGGAGNDYLNGGHYNDTYTGGDGADTFVFNQHEDVITDYDAAEGDRLQFDDALWGGGAKTDAELLAYATVAGGDIVFDFGYGHTLTLEGTTDLDALNGQMQIY